MKEWLLILIGTVIIVLLDLLWLGLIMKGFYEQIPGRGDIRFIPAVLVWLLISAGIVLFVLPHATGWLAALGWGALFGFILYAVYDLTNYAILAGWPVPVVIVDILWGCVLCGATSALLSFLKT